MVDMDNHYSSVSITVIDTSGQNGENSLDCSSNGRARKVLDFFSNNLNTTLIRGVKFQHTGSYELWSEEFASKCQNG